MTKDTIAGISTDFGFVEFGPFFRGVIAKLAEDGHFFEPRVTKWDGNEPVEWAYSEGEERLTKAVCDLAELAWKAGADLKRLP